MDVGFRFSLRDNMGRKKRGVIELRDFNMKDIAEQRKEEDYLESSGFAEKNINMENSRKERFGARKNLLEEGTTTKINIVTNVNGSDLKEGAFVKSETLGKQTNLLRAPLLCKFCDFAVSNSKARGRQLLMHQAREHFKTQLDSVLPPGCRHCPECSFQAAPVHLLRHWVVRHATVRNWVAEGEEDGGLATDQLERIPEVETIRPEPERIHEVETRPEPERIPEVWTTRPEPERIPEVETRPEPERIHEVETKGLNVEAWNKDIGSNKSKLDATVLDKSLRSTIKVECQFCEKKMLAKSYYNHKRSYCLAAKVAAAKALYNVDIRKCYVQVKKLFFLLKKGQKQTKEKLSLAKKNLVKKKMGKESSILEPTCEYERIRAKNIADRKAMWDILKIEDCIKDAKQK